MGRFINPFTDYGFKKIFGQEISKDLFMNFLMDGNVKLRTDVILADRDTGELFTDKMRQTFLALPLFDKEEDECENDFDRWLYILKNMETLKRMPFKARKAVFKKLEEIADVASLSGEERERYENSVNAYRTHLCVIGAAEKEGMEKGIAKAYQATARKMKAKGFDYDTISEITGLTIEEIGEL